MDLPIFDQARILSLLSEIVQEHPGAAQPNERFDMFHGDGDPRCIVGHVLFAGGVRMMNTYWEVPNEVPPMNARMPEVASFSPEMLVALNIPVHSVGVFSMMALENDRGKPWKEIYDFIDAGNLATA